MKKLLLSSLLLALGLALLGGCRGDPEPKPAPVQKGRIPPGPPKR